MPEIENAYQLKITLNESEPPIWRRFVVSEAIMLPKLHEVIQEVMGWSDMHLHEFEFEGETYGTPDPDSPTEIINEKNFKLNQLIRDEKEDFQYTYDLGDNWVHTVVLEKVLAGQESPVKPRCLDGQMACPPEDCGGMLGYYDMLEILQDPDDPEYEETLEWIGGEFDPEEFDIEWINQELEKMK